MVVALLFQAMNPPQPGAKTPTLTMYMPGRSPRDTFQVVRKLRCVFAENVSLSLQTWCTLTPALS